MDWKRNGLSGSAGMNVSRRRSWTVFEVIQCEDVLKEIHGKGKTKY